MDWDGQGHPRWAKCDYITTVSLQRCTDPYRRVAYGPRAYVKVRIAKVDLEAVERCVLLSLGINPTKQPPACGV